MVVRKDACISDVAARKTFAALEESRFPPALIRRQSPEEAEILFTLLAERYERRPVFITSNFDLLAVGLDLWRSDGDGGGD